MILVSASVGMGKRRLAYRFRLCCLGSSCHFLGDCLESSQSAITHLEMSTHGLIQQWPDCIGEIRFTIVNDVLRHVRADSGAAGVKEKPLFGTGTERFDIRMGWTFRFALVEAMRSSLCCQQSLVKTGDSVLRRNSSCRPPSSHSSPCKAW